MRAGPPGQNEPTWSGALRVMSVLYDRVGTEQPVRPAST
jgi:hypothetical protein